VVAERTLDVFLKTYEPKYRKATKCLQKDWETLLTFYAFPAQRWQSLRMMNPIESTFGTIRHRTTRTKGRLTRDGVLQMLLKLGHCAEKIWRRLQGFQQLPKVLEQIQFVDGIEESTKDSVAAQETAPDTRLANNSSVKNLEGDIPFPQNQNTHPTPKNWD